MAKYTCTHRCGHDHEYQLLGPSSERDRKLDWLQDQLCPTCRGLADDATRQEQNTLAATANAAVGAVPLTGSEAQVGYAEAIRAQVLPLFAEAMTKSGDALAPFVQAATLWLMDQSAADWWIENYKACQPAGPDVFQLIRWTRGQKQLPPDAIAVARRFLLQVPTLTPEIAARIGLAEELNQILTQRAATAAKIEALAALKRTRPVRPAFLQALAEEFGSNYNWNAKIYSGPRIYVSNREVKLTADQGRDLTAYSAACAAWAAKKKSVES